MICSTVGNTWAVFSFWLIVNNTGLNMFLVCLWTHNLLDEIPKVELLGLRVRIFTCEIVSQSTAIYTSTCSVCGFQLLHIVCKILLN